jgi:hypothetical protein
MSTLHNSTNVLHGTSLACIRAVLPAFMLVGLLLTTSAPAVAQSPGTTSTNQGQSKLDAMPKDLQKIDTKQGNGAEAVSGKPVIVHLHGLALRRVET